MKIRQPTLAKPAVASALSLARARNPLLQRKCACGGTPGPTGECEKCRKKQLQRKSLNSEAGTRRSSLTTIYPCLPSTTALCARQAQLPSVRVLANL